MPEVGELFATVESSELTGENEDYSHENISNWNLRSLEIPIDIYHIGLSILWLI